METMGGESRSGSSLTGYAHVAAGPGSRKNKCGYCGLKKSYALSWTNGQASQAQMRPVSASAAVAPVVEQDIGTQSDTVEKDNGLDRQHHQNAIKDLQEAVSHLANSDLHAATRVSLEARIAEHKRAIIKMKPIGGQLNGCKAALERAQTRRVAAVKDLEIAQAAVTKADAEITNLSSEIEGLEQQLSTGQDQETQSMDCIEKMACSLKEVLGSMASSSQIPPDVMQQTESHMTRLLIGIKQIAAKVQEQQEAQRVHSTPKREPPEATGGIAARRRLTVKADGLAHSEFVAGGGGVESTATASADTSMDAGAGVANLSQVPALPKNF